jgi:hypothetical protein
MKTLREYLDQLDEISRRDFLRGAGAAAAGAALGKLSPAQAQSAASISRYAADLAVRTVLGRVHTETGYDLRNYISENVYKFVSLACGMGKCPDRELIDRVNNLAAEEAGITKLNFVTGMLTNMKDRTKDFVLAYANHLSDELDRPSSRSSDRPSSDERQSQTSKSKDQETEPIQPGSTTRIYNPNVSGKLPYSSLSSMDEKTIGALVNMLILADKNKPYKGLAWETLSKINLAYEIPGLQNIIDRQEQKLKKMSQDDPKTYRDAYVYYNQQTNQDKIWYAGRELTDRLITRESQSLEESEPEDPIQKIDRLFRG